jgi:hypothetical protein
MCGACGSGTVRPPWEVVLAGDRPADRRRRATAAAEATGGRVKVTPWGAAGYLAAPRTGPPRSVPDLDSLAHSLLPHLRAPLLPRLRPPLRPLLQPTLPLPGGHPCPPEAEGHRVGLPADTDLQRLAVGAALAAAHGGAGPLTVEIHVHRPGVPVDAPGVPGHAPGALPSAASRTPTGPSSPVPPAHEHPRDRSGVRLRVHRGGTAEPTVLLHGPHAEEYGAFLLCHLAGARRAP